MRSFDSLIELTPEAARSKRNIDLRLYHEAVKIITESKKIVVKNDSGQFEESYDKLMIATGARPNTLGIEVNQFNNIFTVHSLDDAEKIKGYISARRPSRIGIIGGGYIGLEISKPSWSTGAKIFRAPLSLSCP